MDRGNPRRARIIRIQSGRYGRKGRHEPICGHISPIGAAEQALDLALLADHETLVTPLDQRCAGQEQALIGAGEAEIVLTGLAQPPYHRNHVFVTLMETEYLNVSLMSMEERQDLDSCPQLGYVAANGDYAGVDKASQPWQYAP